MTARPTRLILLAARHAAAVRLLLLGLLLLSAAAIAFGHFSSDISRMLPDSSVSARTYRAVARSGMSNSVALLFLLPEGKTFAESGLGPCLDRLAESLRNLPAVESVDFKIAGDFSGSMRELAIRIPQIFPVPDTDPETAARKVYGGLDERLAERAAAHELASRVRQARASGESAVSTDGLWY